MTSIEQRMAVQTRVAEVAQQRAAIIAAIALLLPGIEADFNHQTGWSRTQSRTRDCG